jgi:hypothetical protein
VYKPLLSPSDHDHILRVSKTCCHQGIEKMDAMGFLRKARRLGPQMPRVGPEAWLSLDWFRGKSIGNTWFFPMTTWGGPVNIPLNQPNDNTTLYCLGIWKVWNSIPHWGDCSWVHSIMWLVSSDYLSDWINPPKLGNQFKSQTTVPFQRHSEVGNTHVSCIMYHPSI